ncbi:MAG TPA: hypothetical protein VIH90_07160 [Candidatus Saccharimonadales bacterium]|jgi:hypothetical protein
MTKTAIVILSEILQGIHEVRHIAEALKEVEDEEPSRLPEEVIQKHNISAETAEEIDKMTSENLATFIEECKEIEERTQLLIMSALDMNQFRCSKISNAYDEAAD